MIPVAGPSITQRELDYVADAAANAWYENANVYHERFERAFADYVGTRYAIALPSCTSAIHLALAALNVGPGDEVVVPDLTWIASAAPVSYVGATPVFADIDERSWCLAPEAFERAVTDRTKAVIPVDLYGGMPAMDAIREIARRRGVAVIEDAAEAFGSRYRGARAGSLGDVGVFSFHGSKTITTGEGGMAVSDDEALYRRMLVLRDHGRHPGDVSFFNREVGFKYKMSSLQAALGLAQVERADDLVERKRRIFAHYDRRLAGRPGVTLNAEGPGVRSSYWMVTVVLDPALGLRKEEFGALLADRGVATRPFFHPLSALPAYRGCESANRARERNEVSYRVAPYGLNLPSAHGLTSAQIDYVCDQVLDILSRPRRAA